MLHYTTLLLVPLFLATSTFAQEGPSGVPVPMDSARTDRILKLDELAAEALRNNPQLRAARHQTSAAQTRVDQVSSWDAPQLGVEFYQTPIRSFPNPLKR